ncbi:MAG: aldo/keto reductase [Oscillospiraceae bacterium]|jgi:predicted aldo/keto reductase-like oxidoreductase|nr:aldo/keto reductase [Oscillospiraceae bacterium]
MQYRLDGRSGNKLSVLGLGCMRFPRGVTGIDLKKSEQIVMRAIDAGVNYFDTAYLYLGAEAALGTILARNNVRDKVCIATKLPIANCRVSADFDRFFGIQLAALNTDYIDYYLMHNINSLAQWEELCALGIEPWIAAQKASGRVRQLGFSFHGAREEFSKILDAYDWDFCQIQYNYSNENYQAGVDGLRRAAAKHIPVIIMEPLLGGKLAHGLAPAAVDAFRAVDASRSPAAWGLRWLWNQPEVTVVLSGMNELAQLEDNLATADATSPDSLTDAEKAAYHRVIEVFKSTDKVPCTGCSYCMPCPQGVNIPACFASYNASYTHGRITSFAMYITGTAANRRENALASKCVKCGKCETHCPQKIEIRRSLDAVARRMEPLYIKAALKVMQSRAK